jgi:arsenite methyltransferase
MDTPMTARPPVSVEPPLSYFDLQASWGFTKHLGGMLATDTLLAHCGIGDATRLLEVGCGVGITACHAAQRFGCRVVAVDLSAPMIAWARRRVRRLTLAHQITFATADAQRLPFPNDSFDAVICESVLAFVPDPGAALAEFARVTRPGGSVGLTEGIWRKAPPPELAAYLARATGGAHFHSPDVWTALLHDAGLTITAAECRRVSALAQWRDDLGRLSGSDLGDYARAWRAFLTGLVTSPALRRYVASVWPTSPRILRVFDTFGYGIFVGRKEAPIA